MLNNYFDIKNHFKTQWKTIIKLCKHSLVKCFAFCLVKILGVFVHHNIINIFFLVYVFSFFVLFGFFCIIELSMFITNVNCIYTSFHFLAFSFSSLCTTTNYTQMFSSFSAPMLETLNPTSMFVGKLNSSFIFFMLQSSPTQPSRSLFGSSRSKSTKNSSSSN